MKHLTACRYCGRDITLVIGAWVDPNATGDDNVWRETCDSHDTFTAEHEPVAEHSARESVAERFHPYNTDPFRPDCIFEGCDKPTVVVDTSEDNLRYGRFSPLCFEHALALALDEIRPGDVRLSGELGRVKLDG